MRRRRVLVLVSLLLVVLLGVTVALVKFPRQVRVPDQVATTRCAAPFLGTRTFPTEALTGVLRLGLNQDPSADPNTWAWTDVSAYLRDADNVVVRYGRTSEVDSADPASIEFALNSDNGRFVPGYPTGANYPYMKLGVPVQWLVSPGDGLYERFNGFISEITPEWDDTGNQTIVRIVANGVSRRLGQGRALRSPSWKANIAANPLTYWPLEDDASATQAANAIAGGAPMVVDTAEGTPGFGSGEGLPGTPSILGGSSGGKLTGTVPAGTSNTEWRVDFVARLPNEFTGFVQGQLMQIHTEGTYSEWHVLSNATDWRIIPYLSSGLSPGGSIASSQDAHDGELHHYRIEISQSGSNIAVRGYQDGVLGINTTLNSATVGRITRIVLWYSTQESANMPSIGHIAVWAPYSSSITDLSTPALGYEGESAGARFRRLCTEEGLLFTVDTGSTESMGTQTSDTLLELLRDSETADHGQMTDYGFGTRLIPRESRFNRAVDLELDTGLLGQPPRPALDDRYIRNDIRASRPDGSSARHVDSDHLAVYGRYDGDEEVNVLDEDLVHHAEWYVHLGTLEGMRYPQLSLNLRRTPELIQPWCNAGLGARLRITGLPASHPADGIDVFVEGYTETFNGHTWRVDINASPYRPFELFRVRDAQYGRVDGDTSAIVAAIDTDDTSLSVATGAGLVGVGTAAVGNGSGGSVTPALPTGVYAGNLLLLLAMTRNSTGPSTVNTPAGWTRLAGSAEVGGQVDELVLFGRIATSSETAPVVTFASGSAGDDTIAQIAAFHGATNSVDVSSIELTSGDDITYPAAAATQGGGLVIFYGTKGSDWTSVASPGTELGEPDSTAGDTAGMAWAYQTQSSAATVSAGSFVVTGGIAAFAFGGVCIIEGADTTPGPLWTTTATYPTDFPLDIEIGGEQIRVTAISGTNSPQTFTVQRSINGVVKSHAAGSAVRLWKPGQVSL